MLSRLNFMPTSSRPFTLRTLACSSNRHPPKESVVYMKPLSFYVHYRWKSSNDNHDNAITSHKENEHGQITVAEKVKQTTKDAGYLGIIIAGVGVTGIMFYAIFRELFSRQSPNSVYSSALKLCRNEPSVVDTLGEPIKGYGELSSRGRRRHVSHFEYEKDGKNYMRLKFYVEGTRKTGTVHLEMVEDDKSKFQYRYLFVDVDGYPKKTIILKDNRHLDGNFDNSELNLLK
ncbi:mitochondrial import inner membrane translocase subunit Tim21 [Parasteatoda tepidariorum]|uniref:mitochondrial import inner membrane translocase subunit Tim21 n=1 Tax=Parasteatoda tepidariorum TaxID=114398 RepID=UPI00077FD6DE|nr:mitochondrial import inner membrane translocase subunit Tim21 [Parasteatoda tepidariorum]XP_015925603.1 mitochondrial import inner membrane translocase subunit Tim21 [Parasteatoda tepidariorum]XP_021001760.1 mitochondrial import inner membrane translocase subunit Tim21 [Parasteatoda tepidariorum]